MGWHVKQWCSFLVLSHVCSSFKWINAPKENGNFCKKKLTLDKLDAKADKNVLSSKSILHMNNAQFNDDSVKSWRLDIDL